MKDQFENVSIDDILSFLREIKFYQKYMKCKVDPYKVTPQHDPYKVIPQHDPYKVIPQHDPYKVIPQHDL